MGSALTYVRALARNNALANHRLLTACARLKPSDLDAPCSGFFPTIRRTLNHILVVDWFYLDALEEGGRGPSAFVDENPCATLRDLMIEQRAADLRLVEFCDRLDETRLDARVRLVRTDGVAHFDTIERVFFHLCTHQIHHRGQVHAMLSSTPVDPPQLDEFLLGTDADLRGSDLDGFGWTESDLWPI